MLIDTAGLAQTDRTAHKSHGKIEVSRARGQLLTGQSFKPLIRTGEGFSVAGPLRTIVGRLGAEDRGCCCAAA